MVEFSYYIYDFLISFYNNCLHNFSYFALFGILGDLWGGCGLLGVGAKATAGMSFSVNDR